MMGGVLAQVLGFGLALSLLVFVVVALVLLVACDDCVHPRRRK